MRRRKRPEDITTDELPNTLHELLAVGIEDMERVLMNPGYAPDGNIFHAKVHRGDREKCAVCLSGAVMAKLIPPYVEAYPEHFGSIRLRNKLSALEALRHCSIGSAFMCMYVDIEDYEKSMHVCAELENMWPPDGPENKNFHDRKTVRMFLADMRTLQKQLAERNL